MRSELADDEDMRELIVEFVTGLPARTATMRNLASTNQVEALRAIAHQLKGAGGGYGYPLISQTAASLEHAILAQAPESVLLERLAALIGCCETAVTGLAPDPGEAAH
ncbi:MAG: Hpt domain-containing protein [Gammaproteobacteria bacterium]|nr:Hpt domain-containing protein [Gammaproteobacteria bacterium]